MPKNKLYVLLGADYCGKSSLLRSIRELPGWKVVSYDDEFLDLKDQIIQRLRNDFVKLVLPQADHLSDEFMGAYLRISLLYMRDQIRQHLSTTNVIIDSYHYKILAKCKLKGLVDPRDMQLRQTLLPADRIIFLDASPATLRRRLGDVRHLNWFEHTGNRASMAGFTRFQNDLRVEMLRAARGTPTVFLDSNGTAKATSRALRAMLTGERG